ncbi:hypothetical protein PHLCEN_2v8780 [Hermanssonia centrifuga]|uniref:Uncharacterized protein n=1 Tax=Hermanssonia centrifuga TaxID=98765 RepID=A0A2R6NSG4_9APHY|nr:hypothetical protein PHLCEN_2v8780 [Hermanssonia centrifuga]
MKEVTFVGDIEEVESGNRVAGAPDGGRPRVNVCLRDANFAEAVLGGVGGRLKDPPADLSVGDGDPGMALIAFKGAGAFFFPAPNERKNDHSDSN